MADLYDALLALAQRNKAFYFKDVGFGDGVKYRIFNYRVASWTDFQEPGGLECRGIMFDVSAVPVALACRPMAKFFNLNENPGTRGLDLARVDAIEEKAGGSLISTFTHRGQLRVKSKASIWSKQVVAATAWLADHPALRDALAAADSEGWTVNMEWCAPENRIVIAYPVAHLVVLNARRRDDGSYMDRDELEARFAPHGRVVERVRPADPVEFLGRVHSMQDGDLEGYVARIGDLWFKLKTDRYVSVHHARGLTGTALTAAVVDGGGDDLIAMAVGDDDAIAGIEAEQRRVAAAQTAIVGAVQAYHAEHGSKDRGAYARGAQSLRYGRANLLSLAMKLYDGKEPDYNVAIKRALAA